MKLPSLLCVLCLLSVSSRAADPLRPSILNVEVKNIGSGNTTDDTFRDGYGSHEIATASQRRISIRLASVGQTTLHAHIVTYWIAKPLRGGDPFILAKNEKDQVVDPVKPVALQNASGEVRGHDLNLPLANYRRTTGNKLTGWVVHVTSENPEQWLASDLHLIDLARHLDNDLGR